MPAPRPPAIRVTGLRKSFGALTVLDGIDLTVPAGTVLALLGPNGAGKTTTVNILSTLVRADAGTAEVDGHDVAASPDDVRAAIGVTGQFSAVDTLLTARENLRLMADLHHLPRVEGRARADALLERFELSDAAERRGIQMHVGPILAADAFYTDRPDLYDTLADYGVLAVEMESAALYTIASRYKARALTLLTVSDHIKTGEHTSAQEREQTFSQMVEIALDTAIGH